MASSLKNRQGTFGVKAAETGESQAQEKMQEAREMGKSAWLNTSYVPPYRQNVAVSNSEMRRTWLIPQINALHCRLLGDISGSNGRSDS